jgi:hypothetical protein
MLRGGDGGAKDAGAEPGWASISAHPWFLRLQATSP